MDKHQYYIGLMSGTSLDGLDGVLVRFSDQGFEVLHHAESDYSEDLQARCFSLFTSGPNEVQRIQEIAAERTAIAANIVERLCAKINKRDVIAIGDHGQTVRHCPHAKPPYSLQIHHGARLSELTGVTSVVDFRSRDIASGGQGAPLVPAFHKAYFSGLSQHRIIVNIGGIANISLLSSDASSQALGFDTGPGNTLLDSWVQQHTAEMYDANGAWAKSGRVNQDLLNHLLDDPYFRLTAPKSTGREIFNLNWLQSKLAKDKFSRISAVDVQTSLTQMTADTILRGIQLACQTQQITLDQDIEGIYLCGGGAYNLALLEALKAATDVPVQSTEALGVDPKQVEAVAMAWLAKRAIEGIATDLTSSTGAQHPNILGAIYQA